MAFQQYFMQEWRSTPTSATYSEKSSACFDCNICLDFARDPVVTLCGHLYCWPCIYRWIDSQSASLPSGQLPQCPVCKAETSEETMVPLYGRGQSISTPDQEGKAIPPRPPACGIQGQLTFRHPHQNMLNFQNRHNDHQGDSEPPLHNVGVGAPLGLSHPMMGMLGEMVSAGVFGNSASLYTYPNSYNWAASSTPRLRRRDRQAEKSLNRVCIFLFCFFLVCLLLF